MDTKVDKVVATHTDGGHVDSRANRGQSSRRRKSSTIWLLLFPVLSALAGVALWSVSQGETADDNVPLASVAIQPSDLPASFRKCSFSGDADTYLANAKRLNVDTYNSVLKTWNQLKLAGASDAYFATYGNNRSACDTVFRGRGRPIGDVMEHTREQVRAHPVVAWSIVVQFRDEAAARSAYESNIFGQENLKGQQGIAVAEGEASGLGPNSVVAASVDATIPQRQAIWQKGSLTVFSGSANLPLDESRKMTAAIHGRIPGGYQDAG